MKNLTKGIFGKLTGSTLDAYITGRLYKGRAPAMTDYPYVTFGVIGGNPDYTFSEVFESPTIQFDIFSALSGTTEVEDIFTALTTLFDEASFTPTSETVINMTRSNYNLISEEHTVVTGLQQVWHYSIDYEIFLQRS